MKSKQPMLGVGASAALLVLLGPVYAQQSTVLMPTDEAALLQFVNSGRAEYQAAGNDLAKGVARARRASRICDYFQARDVGEIPAKDWIGEVVKTSSTKAENGVLDIELAKGVDVATSPANLRDTDHTVIPPGSPVRGTAAILKKGQKVTFSGVFFGSQADCLHEISLGPGRSVLSPKFEFRFSDLEAIP